MFKVSKHEKVKVDYLILAFVTALVFLLHVIHINKFSIFSILDDEYGYCGNAAYLSGLNWSDTVSKIPYYSFGYSLLLVPLFWIFDNTIYMYRAAIFLNGIMICASFLLCYNISRKLMDNVNKYILLIISLLISMYPTYITYANIAWSECLLMFIYWLLTWCFLGLNDKSKAYKFYLIGMLNGYIYFVHQRALGILIASILVVLIMKILNKISFKQFIRVILCTLLIISIGYFIKSDIQRNLWLNGTELSINDYSGQVSKLDQLFSLEGFLKAFRIFLGQFFYLGASSYLIFYFGLYDLIEKTAIMLQRNNKKNIVSNNYNSYSYMYMFLMISVTITMSISAIFFINPIRINEIVFGRYNEMILGPLMLIGFLRIINGKRLKNNHFIYLVIFFIFLTIITVSTINSSYLNVYQTIDIVGLLFIQPPYGIYITAVIVMIIFRLIFIAFSNSNNKLIIITLLLLFSIYFGIGESKSISLVNHNQEMMKMIKITDIIKSSQKELPIYFLCNDTENHSVVKWNNRTIRDRSVSDCYQFILKDINIKPINAKELRNIKEKKYVLTTSNVDISEILDDYQICGNDEGSILLKTK
ncbi:MAG: hypothetical protein AAGU39_12730 [Sedimentibacter saalensis]|uniref:hypothetical protein n=1 Tax=Sedimentibacter saalensis TaxID=130788 RepID=UPI003158F55B